MSWVHIVTVGASLATNRERIQGSGLREYELEEMLRVKGEAYRNNYVRELVKFIVTMERDGRIHESCAELNALSRRLNEVSMVYLVHPDTELGRCCARALKDYLESKKVRVAGLREVEGLRSSETFQEGLANLVYDMAELLAAHRGSVRICATGGFKPETAIASIVGFIAKAPVYYIHEAFREEIHLPSIPIKWSIDGRYIGAIEAILSTEEGLDIREFEKKFGYDAARTLLDSWMIEEYEKRYRATKITRAILQAIRLLR
ncbi:MAG: putative CRISPR-associated protein [Nitrososphaerota archaeon]|nr:putative CRISPR-associated protein [Candidatus Bathyarchaeota archaeon]MCX8161381.1 putative CRISPR-associated protein [Candidatus Bathyarchaeota archaeon]MDW8062462.1 putative CRISPR-associated protein [Nitrososphaerota archaeon]